MRALLVSGCLVLAACTLPGRQSLAPAPVSADPQSIGAAKAFDGRVALVTIQPGTVDFAGPLKDAVDQALAIKPDAEFRVQAEAPPGGPDAGAIALGKLAPEAQSVAAAIVADGVAADHVSLAAASGSASLIAIYVK